MIHPSAIIDPKAELDENVKVGPFSVIGAGVQIGAGTEIAGHVIIEGPTTIGRDNRIYAFNSIGGEPQDKKYKAQPTRLEIGDRNTIREYCTFNRGTEEDGGLTRVGNGTIFANAASLAGHCRVDDFAILGGFTLVHQFCQVGAHAFTAMGSVINRDVPPFVTVAGSYAEPHGINSEGLKRRGFDSTRISSIKRAYRTIYKSGLSLADARAQLAEAAKDAPDVASMLEFIDRSQRSLVR